MNNHFRFPCCVLSTITAIVLIASLQPALSKTLKPARSQVSGTAISLDGEGWVLATDPSNVGRERERWTGPTKDARPAEVPSFVRNVFPGHDGVAWYWRSFTAPRNPHPGGRYMLRFWSVYYTADVWVNGVHVGAHEGGDVPFVLDVTRTVRRNGPNMVAVRVLIPSRKRIDGFINNEVPGGVMLARGGIEDLVELLVAPAVRVEDLYVNPDPKTGVIDIHANIRNTGGSKDTDLEFSVAPAAGGVTLATKHVSRKISSGDTQVNARLKVQNPRLWQLNDPSMYRVSAKVQARGSDSIDQQSVRCGFRDFRFENGYFRLNGRRIFLRGSLSANFCPDGISAARRRELLRREIVNMKTMGFNTLRYIAFPIERRMLDLCDEIGMMVYEEPRASWLLRDSDRMKERFDQGMLEMVKRDRNHPSVTMWGLLNETGVGPRFYHALAIVPKVRSLDPSRVIMLGSGRSDGLGNLPNGFDIWTKPHVAGGVIWNDNRLALYPGGNGEYTVLRWTAPSAGAYTVLAKFTGASKTISPTSTDVHIFHKNKAIWDSWINQHGQGNSAECSKTVAVESGDTVDFVVGYGFWFPDFDSTFNDRTDLEIHIESPDGKRCNPTAEFSRASNPNGQWSYGYYEPGKSLDASTFSRYETCKKIESIGSYCNPGSMKWGEGLSDLHHYPGVPHMGWDYDGLRGMRCGDDSVFLSEYGVGSGVDIIDVQRHFESEGEACVRHAGGSQGMVDSFLADWNRWHMADTFGRPEDFLRQSVANMAELRLMGASAIRANPKMAGHCVTCTADPGAGDGLMTIWRETKQGTMDAMFDAWAPLRLCMFADPTNMYRGAKVKLEVVLANEDVLAPGEYPVMIRVLGPNAERVFERRVSVTIPDSKSNPEPPLAIPVFSESVTIDGSSGEYHFVAAFEKGGAAAGGDARFFVADPAEMPRVDTEVVLWGEDKGLEKWLADKGIRVRSFSAGGQAAREVILVGDKPAPGGANAFAELARHIARGSTAIFLSPAVFANADQAEAYVPLSMKGQLVDLPSWLFHKDEWASRHAVFDGLPVGLMDYTFYGGIIPGNAWSLDKEMPVEAVAGAINTSTGYSSGLMVSVHRLGTGTFVLNTLKIQENLGDNPVAERLLRNLLRYANRDIHEPLKPLPGQLNRVVRGLLKEWGYRNDNP